MACAAFLPAPMARITVAAPVTASPPAYTPSRVVRPLSSSHDQAAVAVGLQPRRGGADERVGAGADGHDHRSPRPAQSRCPPGRWDGGGRFHPARPESMRTQRMPHTLPFSSPSTSTGLRQGVEDDALLLRVLDLLAAGGHLLQSAAVDDVTLPPRPGAWRSAPRPWPRCRRPPPLRGGHA